MQSFWMGLLLVVSTAALAAIMNWVVARLFQPGPPKLEVVTASGMKIAIDAPDLTRDKVAEITNNISAVRP